MVGPWPPLVGSESVIAGRNLSVPCLSSSRGFSIAEMEGTYLSGARVVEANYGGIFSTLKQPSLLCAWITIITLGIPRIGMSSITFIVTIIVVDSSSVVSEHATRLLSTLNNNATV